MPNRCTTRTLTTVALLAVGVIATVMVARGLAAQVYFEPSPEVLAEARAGLHSERVWGAVLALSAFVVAVLTERVLLLAPILTGIAALFAIAGFTVFLALPVAVVIELGVAIAELVGRRGRRGF